MTSPNPSLSAVLQFCRRCTLFVLILSSLVFASCTRVTKGEPDPKTAVVAEKPAPARIATWLGNPGRNFYGTGPWKDGQLEVIWEFKTGWTSGPLHKDAWSGTSWPGQPSVEGERVYFPSADGHTYSLNRSDGSLVWKFKAKDSFKATPTIAGDKIIASGLDHHVYCLSARDGSVIWDHETGFEVDGAVAVMGDRVYFGGEDRYFYCLSLADGVLIYKTLVGSVEGSVTFKDDRIFLGTEQGDLFCLDPADGAIVWKARIGADSDSTPAVVNGMVYTAAEDGVVRAYNQTTGGLVWNFVTEGAHLGRGSEKRGIWASPIFHKGRIYIGAGNGYLHCLSADKGELVWRYKARGPIWGTSPIVDGWVVFGDKAGWIHLVSAEDGKLISEIKIGDNINSTPAVIDGQIYIGAFNGKLYRLEMRPVKQEAEKTEGSRPKAGARKKKKIRRKPVIVAPVTTDPLL
jgi:outer membrane protein assembly factor BamB